MKRQESVVASRKAGSVKDGNKALFGLRGDIAVLCYWRLGRGRKCPNKHRVNIIVDASLGRWGRGVGTESFAADGNKGLSVEET